MKGNNSPLGNSNYKVVHREISILSISPLTVKKNVLEMNEIVVNIGKDS